MHFFTEYVWKKGQKTAKNQDSLAICQMVAGRRRCLMVLVCDGIGSLAESEKASGFVTEQMIRWFYQEGPRLLGRKRRKRSLENAVRRQLQRIREQMADAFQDRKAGTTFSMLLLVQNRYFIWNAGDSRVYRKRAGDIRQLTEDDTSAGMLTNCIGTFPFQKVRFYGGRLVRKMSFLVCSDGLYRKLAKRDLQALLSADTAPPEKIKTMLKEASDRNRFRGENDDISGVFVKAE